MIVQHTSFVTLKKRTGGTSFNFLSSARGQKYTCIPTNIWFLVGTHLIAINKNQQTSFKLTGFVKF